MDGFTEKKWFVYIGDHHEGPFSLEEIQGKIQQTLVSPESYVWAEGMPDWKLMEEITDFELILPAKVAKSEPQAQSTHFEVEPEPLPNLLGTVLEDPLSRIDMRAEQSPDRNYSSSHASHSQAHSQTHSDANHLVGATLVTSEASTIGVTPVSQVSKIPMTQEEVQTSLLSHGNRKKRYKKFFSSLVVLALLFGGGVIYSQGYLEQWIGKSVLGRIQGVTSVTLQPFLIALAEKFPSLNQWVSPLPAFDNISTAEYEEMKAVVREKMAVSGPKVALALSKTDPLAPEFYLASNLSDGAQFRLYILGVSHTLLNQTSMGGELNVVVNKKFGKSGPFKMFDGKPIPRGEYWVYVGLAESQPSELKSVLSSFQPPTEKLPSEPPSGAPGLPSGLLPGLLKDAKILTFKTYFLGGNRDTTYISGLKEYHDKLRVKAETELGEIRQFVATLESQLTSTMTKYDLVRKVKINPRQRAAWDTFHGEWLKLEGQLDQIFQTWTPEVLHRDHFYETLYEMTQQLGQSIVRVHGFHHAFFVGVDDLKAFEIQLGEATSSAQSTMNLLRAKIEQAAKLSPTPNGMPRKDGI